MVHTIIELKKVMQGRHNKCVCRECGRKKPGNYFISETLCKRCGAKRRSRPQNEIVPVAPGLNATNQVLKRLKKKAYSETPKTLRNHSADILSFFGVAGLSIAMFYAIIVFKDYQYSTIMVLTSTVIFFILIMRFQNYLDRPRDNKIQERVIQLAKYRQESIDEASRFYNSPEWSTLRNRVIREEGKQCNICYRIIKKPEDLTVDHIKPRSVFPELALQRENLRVVCRSCNSRKGARVLEVNH